MPSPKPEFEIDGRKIGLQHPTYFIADIAANHDGDLGRAKDLIFLAKEAGADAAKFQHFRAETIVSDFGFRALDPAETSHQAGWKRSVFDTYQAAAVGSDWTPALKETCDRAGITFFTAPYAFDLVDEVDPYVPAYKLGSGDITWLRYIAYVAGKQKPTIIACGAASIDETISAVEAALAVNPNIALLQCNTNYTGSPENFRYVNLNVLTTFASRFPGMILGLSDHTPGHAAVLGAVALGGRIIEKHFTDDTARNGPDHKFSLDPSTWRTMVDRTRELELALGDGFKRIEDNETQTVVVQRRAIRAARSLVEGTILADPDMVALRPCPADALPPSAMDSLIGRRLRRSIAAGDCVRWSDLEQR